MNLKLLRVGRESAATVQAILDEAPRYLLNCEGIDRDADAAQRALANIPPGHPLALKHSLIVYNDVAPIAFVDLLFDYPVKETCFVGLLLLPERLQGRGLGRKIFATVERKSTVWLMEKALPP